MIRFKIISIIVLSVLLLLGTLSFVSYKILGQTLTDIEDTLMVRNLTRVDSTLRNTRTALNVKLRDWAQWDDTYRFIEDRNPEYVASNLAITTPINLEINLMLFVNREGEVVYFTHIDFAEGVPLPGEGILSEIMRYQDMLLATSTDSIASGIIQYQGSLLLIEALPILPTDGSGPVAGTIMFGRHIDPKMMGVLEELTQLSLATFFYNSPSLPADVATAKGDLDSGVTYVPLALSSDTYAGYFLLYDLSGTPASIVRAETPREVFAIGKKSTFLLTLISAIAVIAVGLAILLLVERVLLRNFTRLTDEVTKISVTNLANAHVSTERKDEVGQLAQKIDELLSEVGRAQEKERTAHKLTLEASEKAQHGLAETERMNKLMINRELKMVELKEKIAELEKRLSGETPG